MAYTVALEIWYQLYQIMYKYNENSIHVCSKCMQLSVTGRPCMDTIIHMALCRQNSQTAVVSIV